MKDKLARFGGRFFDSYELLEMLLYNVIPYKDTKPIAKSLLAAFGSMGEIFDAPAEELVRVEGVGERCAEFLNLAGGIIKTGELVYSNPSSDIFDNYSRTGEFFLRHFRENPKANIAVMLLDGYMRLLAVENIEGESFGSGAVRAGSFIKPALSVGAEIAVIAYTHRYGPLFPTEADRATGKMISEELAALGVTVAEQYVVNGDGYLGAGTGYSFKLSASPNLTKFISSKKEAQQNGAVYLDCPTAKEYMLKYLTRLLSFSLKGDKAAEAASRLCEKYGNIDRLICAGLSELENTEGMNRNAAIYIKLVAYSASRALTDGFDMSAKHSDGEIYEYIKAHFIGLSRETVYILSLDKSGRALSCSFVSEGTVNGSDVYPRRLLEIAIEDGAASVIIAHNHPASSAAPSRDDVASTEGLSEFFESAGIELKAHLIVSGREHCVIIPTSKKRIM